jgi:glycosyltransferase involved in cell wall biosynthesis
MRFPMATPECDRNGVLAPPSVLLVCEWFAKYTAALGRGLQEHGAEVTMLARDQDIEFGDEPGALRRHLGRTLRPGTPVHTTGGRVRDLRAMGRLPALRGAVRSRSHQVVHVQDSVVHDPRLAFAAGLRPGRYAITVHDPVPHPGDPVPSWRTVRTRRALRRHAGLVFVHAAGLREELLRVEPPLGPVVVVPHGMDAPRPTPPPQEPVALFFGRISHYKGLDVLLDAMPLAWASLPALRLVVAGEGTVPEHRVLEDPRVELHLGHVPEQEVAGLFARAGCVVLPYRQASQSGVATQARQHGRAVIASTVGGLPEIIDAATGRLVPPEDPQALASALVEVLGSPQLTADLGAAAVGWADQASWGRIGELTLAAYAEHLAGPATTGGRRPPRGPAPG